MDDPTGLYSLPVELQSSIFSGKPEDIKKARSVNKTISNAILWTKIDSDILSSPQINEVEKYLNGYEGIFCVLYIVDVIKSTKENFSFLHEGCIGATYQIINNIATLSEINTYLQTEDEGYMYFDYTVPSITYSSADILIESCSMPFNISEIFNYADEYIYSDSCKYDIPTMYWIIKSRLIDFGISTDMIMLLSKRYILRYTENIMKLEFPIAFIYMYINAKLLDIDVSDAGLLLTILLDSNGFKHYAEIGDDIILKLNDIYQKISEYLNDL